MLNGHFFENVQAFSMRVRKMVEKLVMRKVRKATGSFARGGFCRLSESKYSMNTLLFWRNNFDRWEIDLVSFFILSNQFKI